MIDIWVKIEGGNITSWADSELTGYEHCQVTKVDFKDFNDTEGKAFEIVNSVAVKCKNVDEVKNALKLDYDKNVLRQRREKECFAICDRPLWLEGLSAKCLTELNEWRNLWLDVTKTLIVPPKPNWI